MEQTRKTLEERRMDNNHKIVMEILTQNRLILERLFERYIYVNSDQNKSQEG